MKPDVSREIRGWAWLLIFLFAMVQARAWLGRGGEVIPRFSDFQIVSDGTFPHASVWDHQRQTFCILPVSLSLSRDLPPFREWSCLSSPTRELPTDSVAPEGS